MYIYLYICIYTYIHTYIHTYVIDVCVVIQHSKCLYLSFKKNKTKKHTYGTV